MSIRTENLTKRFGDVVGLDSLEMEVEQGEIYGFLGPNGAGKSTAINLLLGFISPTEGSASVLGLDAQTESVEIRRRTGVLPDNYGLYDRLTARKHLEFAIRSKDADDDVDALLDRVGIQDAADRKVGGFSKGMQQRLALAQALVDEPDLLILDEPTSGLDPTAIKEMRDIIFAERDRGATVFYSSHILSQVEATCDTVGILNEGRLVAQDSIDSLKETLERSSTLTVTIDGSTDAIDPDPIAGIDGVLDVQTNGTELVVDFDDNGAKTEIITAIEQQTTVSDMEFSEPSMEQLFETYTEEGRA